MLEQFGRNRSALEDSPVHLFLLFGKSFPEFFKRCLRRVAEFGQFGDGLLGPNEVAAQRRDLALRRIERGGKLLGPPERFEQRRRWLVR